MDRKPAFRIRNVVELRVKVGRSLVDLRKLFVALLDGSDDAFEHVVLRLLNFRDVGDRVGLPDAVSVAVLGRLGYGLEVSSRSQVILLEFLEQDHLLLGRGVGRLFQLDVEVVVRRLDVYDYLVLQLVERDRPARYKLDGVAVSLELERLRVDVDAELLPDFVEYDLGVLIFVERDLDDSFVGDGILEDDLHAS